MKRIAKSLWVLRKKKHFKPLETHDILQPSPISQNSANKKPWSHSCDACIFKSTTKNSILYQLFLIRNWQTFRFMTMNWFQKCRRRSVSESDLAKAAHRNKEALGRLRRIREEQHRKRQVRKLEVAQIVYPMLLFWPYEVKTRLLKSAFQKNAPMNYARRRTAEWQKKSQLEIEKRMILNFLCLSQLFSLSFEKRSYISFD